MAGKTIQLILTDSSGSQYVLNSNDIQNWDSIKPKFERDKLYRGVFHAYTNIFEFVNSIRETLRTIYLNEGIDGVLKMEFQVGNQSGHIGSYRTLRTYEADFSTYKAHEAHTELEFNDSGFETKIRNRQETEINMNKLTSIDGDAITPFNDEFVNVLHNDRRLQFNNEWESPFFTSDGDPYEEEYVSLAVQSDRLSFLRIEPKVSDDPITGVQASRIIAEASANEADADNFIYFDNDESKNINFDFSTYVIDVRTSDKTHTGAMYFYIFDENDDGTRTFNRSIRLSNDITVTNNDVYVSIQFINENLSVPLAAGQSLALVYRSILSSANLFGMDIRTSNILRSNSITLFKVDDQIQTVTSPAHLIYDIFTRYLQVITGEEAPFYSSVFGYPDAPTNEMFSTENQYTEFGEFSQYVCFNGYMLRGFDINDYPFNMTFKDFFTEIANFFNVGAGIEEIDGNMVFRVEPIEYFYDRTLITRLEDTKDIVLAANKNRVYGSIKAGQKDQEYESFNGVLSFAGLYSYATPVINSDKKLEINVDKLRSDDIGIEDCRRQQVSVIGNEDTRYDEENFILRVVPTNNANTPWQSKQNVLFSSGDAEYYSVIENIFEPEYATNLDLSAGRCLRRWDNIFTSGLIPKSGRKMIFTAGAANFNLISQAADENEPIDESADITIDFTKLSYPLFLADDITGESIMTLKQYIDLDAKKRGVFALDIYNANQVTEIYGFVDVVEYNLNDDFVSLQLTRANL